jgi:hypothetical protein
MFRLPESTPIAPGKQPSPLACTGHLQSRWRGQQFGKIQKPNAVIHPRGRGEREGWKSLWSRCPRPLAADARKIAKKENFSAVFILARDLSRKIVETA